jgi:hypothetical protein
MYTGVIGKPIRVIDHSFQLAFPSLDSAVLWKMNRFLSESFIYGDVGSGDRIRAVQGFEALLTNAGESHGVEKEAFDFCKLMTLTVYSVIYILQ